MALDEALLLEAGRTGAAFLRLYRFSPPTLSFGRNEPTTHYDRALIERLGLPVVRRPTGGRAVWHEHEVTYAVAAPIAAFGSLRESYVTIHERLATALRSLGVDARLADRPTAQPADRHGSCFAAPVGGEIVVRGRKLVGSAQVRRGSAMLQHGSILLDGSQERVREVSKEPGAGGSETTLAEILGRTVTFAEVADAIVAVWPADASAALRRPAPSSPARYSDPAWTWRR